MPPRDSRSLFCRVVSAVLVVFALAADAGPARAERVEPPPSCDRDVAPPCPPPPDRPPSWLPDVSGDGRYLTFYSAHHLLLDGSLGGIFRFDRHTGAVARIHVDSLGRTLTRYATPTSISHDGDRVVFSAVDWGAPSGDQAQLWVHEFSTGRTILVTADTEGKPTTGWTAAWATISPDGRFVGFASQSGELVPGDRPTGSVAEAYVRDLELGRTTRVSIGTGGLGQDTNVNAGAPSVSADGRFVAFTSIGPLIPEDTNGAQDVYVRDMQTGRLEIVSKSSSGEVLPWASLFGFSDDGTRVLFAAAPDALGRSLYLRDRSTGATRALYRLDAKGPQIGQRVALSGDGNVMAVQTSSPVGVADIDGRDDIVLVDTRTGAERPTTPDGMTNPPDAQVVDPALSFDGSVLAVDTAWRHIEPADSCCDENIENSEIYTYAASTGAWEQITPRTAVLPLPPPLPPGPPPVTPPARPSPTAGNAAADGSGYWMLGEAGDVYAFGAAGRHGNGTARSVDIEPTPAMDGYWILDRAGRVAARGAAPALGDAALRAGEHATSLSATLTGRGYWVFTDTGRVVTIGDAVSFGDMSGARLNSPVLGSIVTPSGRGYWMVASDGGIFSFGDARFHGSMGGRPLNRPIVSMAPDPDGSGYWLVASDGGIFAFDAPFYGSMGAARLNKPVTGMVTGRAGYLMVAADGGIFAFGDVPFAGSLGATPPPHPIVAVALSR